MYVLDWILTKLLNFKSFSNYEHTSKKLSFKKYVSIKKKKITRNFFIHLQVFIANKKNTLVFLLFLDVYVSGKSTFYCIRLS